MKVETAAGTDRAANWRKSYRARCGECGRQPGTVETFSYDDVVATYGNVCNVPECSQPFEELGHGVSIRNGGSHTLDNVMPLCRRHNREAGADDMRPVPLGEPEDGQRLADDIARRMREVSSISEADAQRLTLYALGTWHMHLFLHYPRTLVKSAGPGSGKSSIADIMHAVGGANAHRVDTPVTDAVARDLIDDYSPRYLLLDEASALSTTFTAAFNSGYEAEKTTDVKRETKHGWKTEPVNLYGAVSMFGIYTGLRLDASSRVLTVRLDPPTGEIPLVNLWDERQKTEALRARTRRWGHQTAGMIDITVTPERMPENARGRYQEIWEPLIKTGDLLGERWGQLARDLAREYIDSLDETAPRSAYAVMGVADELKRTGTNPEYITPKDARLALITNESDLFSDGYTHKAFHADLLDWRVKSYQGHGSNRYYATRKDGTGVIDGYERVLVSYPWMGRLGDSARVILPEPLEPRQTAGHASNDAENYCRGSQNKPRQDLDGTSATVTESDIPTEAVRVAILDTIRADGSIIRKWPNGQVADSGRIIADGRYQSDRTGRRYTRVNGQWEADAIEYEYSCVVCNGPLHLSLVNDGIIAHPACDPDYLGDEQIIAYQEADGRVIAFRRINPTDYREAATA